MKNSGRSMMCLAFAAAMCVTLAARSQTAANRSPVLVELFTSEGCSSCPPADALLDKLANLQPIAGAEVIALGEHVDYWDGQGWHDRFSAPLFTERQNGYGSRFHLDSVYTPQMVVDGAAQFVGNDAAQARKAIAAAAQRSKFPLAIGDLSFAAGQLLAQVSLDSEASPSSAGKRLPEADVYAALADRIEVTEVRGGENGGRRLTHVDAVRALRRVGTLRSLAAGPLTVKLPLPAGDPPNNLRLVVFAQEPGQGRVLAAAIR